MNLKNLLTRLLTSIVLIIFLALSFNYSYILIVSLIIISCISWIEFQGLISKIYKKKNFKTNFYKKSLYALTLIYLTIFSWNVLVGFIYIIHYRFHSSFSNHSSHRTGWWFIYFNTIRTKSCIWLSNGYG